MLIPREKPYLEGLNSYYLHLEKFITHMQGEIGSGGLHCKSNHLEMLIYFNENEIISCLVRKQENTASHYASLEIARNLFYDGAHAVKVYLLNANAIYFWAQMPLFQRAKAALKSSEIPLPDLIFRLGQKQFSGFIDVQLNGKSESGLLFFHEGKRIGGSYTWGNGGLSQSNDDYTDLLGRLQSGEGAFTFGSFFKENQVAKGAMDTALGKNLERSTDSGHSVPADLRLPLEAFLARFVRLMGAKTRIDPILALREHFQVRSMHFPFLDPGRGFFDYSEGAVHFSSNAPVDKVTRAVITCAWELVRMHNLSDAFASALRDLQPMQPLHDFQISIEG